MNFIKVKVWEWEHFFRGKLTIQTNCETTEQQIQRYIEADTGLGGGGNYKKDSLTVATKKIKVGKAKIINLERFK